MNEEQNRKLAIWLGWRDTGSGRLHSPDCQADISHCTGKAPDFYTDPAANELLLEKMPDPMVWKETATLWGAEASEGFVAFNADRKTAICEAALALIANGDSGL